LNRQCQLCKLSTKCAVPGFGPSNPKLIVISDYPGKKEEEQGKPMVGQAGQLLRAALQNVVGLDPIRDVFYTNVIRCRPDDAGKVGPTELNACRRWTNEELKGVNCGLVLIAGSKAFEAMLGPVIAQELLEDDDFDLSKAHGRHFYHLGRTYLVTWNPAHVEQNSFKDPRKQPFEKWYPTGSVPDLYIKDLKKLRALIEGAGVS
jgi:DNA polymerase